MALNITINKISVAASFAAGATVATAVASGGTTPYIYSLATGGDKFAINGSTGVITTIAAMDITNIASFSVTATDSTTGTALTITSDVIYPPIQAAIRNKFNRANVIYKITKDIDLGHGVLTIPKGCTLDFQGGSFANGTIVGNDTKVIYSSRIFHESIEFEGTWLIPRISTEMFYSLAGENSIKKLMLLSNPTIRNAIIIEKGDYTVSVSANKEEVLELNSNTELIINGNIKLVANEFPNYYIISSNNCSNIHISGNGTIEGDKDTHTGATGEWGMGININNCNGVIIENITIKQCWGDCIYIGTNSKNVKIFNCFLSESRRQGISVTSASEVIIDNCTISNISGTDPQSAINLEPNANEIITNVIIRNITVRTCSCGIISYKPDSGIISNVVISNCYIDNITANKSTIILYGITNSIVRNVIIKNSPDRGITVTNCDGYVIEDCVIDMLPANRGIIPTMSTRGIIRNNIIKAQVAIRDTSNVEICNNTITCNKVFDNFGETCDNIKFIGNKVEGKMLNKFSNSIIDKNIFECSTDIPCDFVNDVNTESSTFITNNIIKYTGTSKVNSVCHLGTWGAIFRDNILYTNNKTSYGIQNYGANTLIEGTRIIGTIDGGRLIGPMTEGSYMTATMYRNKGTTEQRPVIKASDLDDSAIGFLYFDSTLGKYICWDGTKWINIDGTAL